MDSPSLLGVNLGKSETAHGTYNVWIPSLGRVVVSKDVCFDEGYMPFRPATSASR